ncbi:site-specific DNA-methyltransferase [Promethearchaeum syntrophicum]|uniref:Type II methyltransferase n=1 Tax=Promethearchaeum syntrophicum TaxID=2594042 RepID=A0A5B9DB90_9ARCH|nr:site-specific DNA-methyltransferase [Candidatus Prometheoarchaeum syntrophicum]QEE16107.1 Modification methylase MjaI [Candidatus Prometheoarchaeum syntrophicum]
MNTSHKFIYKSADNLGEIKDESIELVITSPPYPMIEMWDEIFCNQNSKIKDALEKSESEKAFQLMHEELKKVWCELFRVIVPGGIVCINIGDATRTIDKKFQLFPSHARIIEHFLELGFQSLPEIIWRKQTNAPNKFMGSGMLPPGAYVTLEHEFILIFRKGNKRDFKEENRKINRRESSYFWEERNIWFSDIWDFKGISQNLNNKLTRKRSAAFPFELAYRLANMFSTKGDTILDPFLGTGTTSIAAMTSERNSIGIEIDISMKDIIESNIENLKPIANNYIKRRIKNHIDFINKRTKIKGPTKYNNEKLGFSVITKQETALKLNYLDNIRKRNENEYIVDYCENNPND